MFNEICLIRCCSCGESKSIFRPIAADKYLCKDCYNYLSLASFNWIERGASDSEVVGSNPTREAPTFFYQATRFSL